jgi:hypothetical protein
MPGAPFISVRCFLYQFGHCVKRLPKLSGEFLTSRSFGCLLAFDSCIRIGVRARCRSCCCQQHTMSDLLFHKFFLLVSTTKQRYRSSYISFEVLTSEVTQMLTLWLFTMCIPKPRLSFQSLYKKTLTVFIVIICTSVQRIREFLQL